MNLSGCVCFSMIMGSVCLRRERAAPTSLISMSSITTWQRGGAGAQHVQTLPRETGGEGGGVRRRASDTNLLVEIDEYVVGKLKRLDGQQDGVPVAALDVGDEAVDALHRVERQGGLLLQGAQRAVEVVLLQVLHDQADHAAGEDRSRYKEEAERPETPQVDTDRKPRGFRGVMFCSCSMFTLSDC